jgi:hypothetical protein
LSFLISSAKATDAFAALIFPYTALPYSYQDFGIIGNIPLISKIFSEILDIEKKHLYKLSDENIIQLRNLPEWQLFRASYLKAITQIENSLTPDLVYHTLIKILQKERKSLIRNKIAKNLDNSILNTVLSVGTGVSSVAIGLSPIYVPIISAAPTFLNKFISKIVSSGAKTPVTDLKKDINSFISNIDTDQNVIKALDDKIKKK